MVSAIGTLAHSIMMSQQRKIVTRGGAHSSALISYRVDARIHALWDANMSNLKEMIRFILIISLLVVGPVADLHLVVSPAGTVLAVAREQKVEERGQPFVRRH